MSKEISVQKITLFQQTASYFHFLLKQNKEKQHSLICFFTGTDILTFIMQVMQLVVNSCKQLFEPKPWSFSQPTHSSSGA